MTAYYNEIDAYAAEWLRNLIKAGEIAPGVVDERSIEDVAPEEIREFTQCHFFAGIGIWSAALRRAGWTDDRPVWTGSCPCQPFSAAGKGGGFDDERHLWPAWQWLISELRPSTVFGEQVASKDGLAWFDLVSSDMEGTGYAVAPIDLCAAGVGAPHIRQRLWFAAERLSDAPSLDRRLPNRRENKKEGAETEWGGKTGGLAQPNGGQRDGRAETPRGDDSNRQDTGRQKGDCRTASGEPNGRMGDAPHQSRERDAGGVSRAQAPQYEERQRVDGGVPERSKHAGSGMGERPGATNGHWRNADWLHCTDGKWRPVEPGTFPLAHGTASRVGRLRAYGNGICLEAAQEIIASFLDVRP